MIVTVTITIEGITLVNHILKLEYVHNLSMVLVKKVKNVEEEVPKPKRVYKNKVVVSNPF